MEILELIKKRKKIVIISTALACLIGVVFSLIIKPSYEATVEIAMQPTDVIQGFSQDTAAVSEYISYQAEIIKSDEVVNDVIDKLHLRMSDVLDLRRPVESFLKHIKVMPIGNNLVRITAVAKTPQLAASMASQLAGSFVELHKEKSFSLSREAMEWLSKSSKLAEDLKEAENKLLNFIKENDMQNPQQRLDYYQQNADHLSSEKAELTLALERNKQALQKLTELTSGKNTAEVITQRLDPSLADVLGSYRKEYTDVQLEIDQLLKRYRPNHPKVIELNQRKDSIIEDIDSKIKELLKWYKDKIDYAGNRIAEIETEIEKEKKEYSTLLGKKKDFDILKARFENLTRLYEEAQQQLKPGSISVVSVSVVGFAGEDSAPVAKTRPIEIFFAIFALAGFIIGVLMAFFLEHSSMERKTPPSKPTEGA